MKRATLPIAPNPSDPAYRGNLKAWQAAAYNWMQQTKQLFDDANRINASPMGQQFVVGTYVTTTNVTGTTTGTDLSNFVSSLVAAMTTFGMVAPVQKRTSE